ncbi:hypothetical protein AgCh_038666 [Apium graveolens]
MTTLPSAKPSLKFKLKYVGRKPKKVNPAKKVQVTERAICNYFKESDFLPLNWCTSDEDHFQYLAEEIVTLWEETKKRDKAEVEERRRRHDKEIEMYIKRSEELKAKGMSRISKDGRFLNIRVGGVLRFCIEFLDQGYSKEARQKLVKALSGTPIIEELEFFDKLKDRLRKEADNAEETLLDPDWITSMLEELNQFERSKYFELVFAPRNRSIIGIKWVYRNKMDENGIITRNKTRLLIKGHSQEEGIDYDENFSPIARLEAMRIFIAFVAHSYFKVYQIDVKSAFLNGELEEEVYVQQPPGFEDPEFPCCVYKLLNTLYGLKKPPRA